MTFPRSRAANSVFIDASAFYALLDSTDQWHGRARDGFSQLRDERRPVVTSNLIMAETYTLAHRRLGYSVAIRWLRGLTAAVIYETGEDHARATALLEHYAQRPLSYVDAVSFAIIARTGIATAFAFDADFRQHGLDMLV